MLTLDDKLRLISPYFGYGHSYRLDCDLQGNIVKSPYNLDYTNLTYIIKSELHVKLLLRSLTDMTHNEALNLISSAAPDIYGDYRYNKWVVKCDKNESDIWKAYVVTRKNDDHNFTVDLIDGSLTHYDNWDEDQPYLMLESNATINPYYRGWYYQHGFDIPTYPTGKTLHELGLAIYK